MNAEERSFKAGWKQALDEVEDILENYKGKYFKIDIKKFNALKRGEKGR